MKQLVFTILALVLPLTLFAQDDIYGVGATDTIFAAPIQSARLQGPREATPEEKAFARKMAEDREAQNQIDNTLPPVDDNGQVHGAYDYSDPYFYDYYGWGGWRLHKGLNVNLSASVFATSGGYHGHSAGFNQDISLMYVTNLSPKATLAVGGYFNNTTWGGDNYTTAGINALIGYRFNEHWSAYAFVQKAFTSDNARPLGYWGYPYWGMAAYYSPLDMGYGGAYRYMDRIGGGVRYDFNNHSSIQIHVEVDRMPTTRINGYDYRHYDYPVR